MKSFYKNKLLFFLFLSLFFFLAAFCLDSYVKPDYNNPTYYIKRAEKYLHKAEKKVIKKLDELVQADPSTYLNLVFDYKANEQNDTYIFLIFENNNLVFWSNNHVPLTDSLNNPVVFHNNALIRLKNGWYESFTRTEKEKTYVGLLLIKNQFVYENQYLSNDFNSFLEFPHEGVNLLSDQNSLEIHSYTGKYLFSTHLNLQTSSSNTFVVFLYILAFIVLCAWLHSVWISHIQFLPLWIQVTWILTLIAGKILTLYLHFPEYIYRFPLFSPQYYASSFLLGSLGDFLINTLLILYLVWILYKRWAVCDVKKYSSQTYLGTLFFYTIYFFSLWISDLIGSLIINSNISFNTNNIFDLNGYSLVGFFIIAILFMSLYLFIALGTFIIRQAKQKPRQWIVTFIAAQLLFGITFLLLNKTPLVKSYALTAYIVTTAFIIVTSMQKKMSLSQFLLIISLFSAFTASSISTFNTQKERENRKLLAIRMESEQDHIAEYLFEDIESKVLNDKVIDSYFAKRIDPQEHIAKRMHEQYFNGYWGNYDITIYCFDSIGNVLSNKKAEFNNLHYFENIIRQNGKPTHNPNFFFIDNASGRISYLAIFSICNLYNTQNIQGTILVELNSKFVQEQIGFPELLLSEKVQFNRELRKYSYAKYKKGQLISQYGTFPYPLFNPFETTALTSTTFLVKEEYDHLLYQVNPFTLIVLSKKESKIFNLITLFSFSFAFFLLCASVGYIVLVLGGKRKIKRQTLNARIQLSVLLIVSLSILFIGGGTALYIINKYTQKQNEQVANKITSLLVMVEDELKGRETLENCIREDFEFGFYKLPGNLSDDFNIYDLRGTLLYSTRPEITEKGIAGIQINPVAYKKLYFEKSSFVIQNEHIGKLRYVSAFAPIRNLHNKVIGYLGLPYFARQADLKKEISSFLTTLINIYVLLFVVTIITAYLISKRITKPLRLIQESLGEIKLGEINELIKWHGKDEIGELIKQYNHMVNELAISAERLAKSERESAWREMAKQVAHEIKNPLTPMRLNIQHLQRLWKEKKTTSDTDIERISDTLIKQIDALSEIATVFSNFAQMPKTRFKKTDLQMIIKNVVNLYKETEGITIHYTLPEENQSSLMVYADEDQLNRAFGNLLKNSIQAVPEGKEGIININIKKDDKNYIVSMRDNGTGVPHDQLDKIFTPNFTTKTSGMGLGLAMVKEIIENAKGRVWFETKEKKGTTFYILLPQLTEDEIN